MGRAPLSDLRGGTPDENAALLRAVLGGRLNGAHRTAALLNAAAALAAESGNFPAAVEEANAALASGAALTKLNALVEYSHSLTPQPVA
jgi:anthranilate phosphoribosyltransferase